MGDTTAKGKGQSAKAVRRGGAGPRAIGAAVAKLARPLLGKRGFSQAAVITQWDAIAGPELAAWTMPTRIAMPRGGGEGVLHLRVAGGAFATAVQHRAPILIARVNAFCGYRAVGAVRIAQGPLPKRPVRVAPPLPPLPPETERTLATAAAGIGDTDLRAALLRLGRAILAK